jgi:16S rRNA processing protein RimM
LSNGASGHGSAEKTMTAAEQWVWLALIRRTQGRKGEVFADILTDFPEKFAERKRLWLLSDETARPPKNSRGPVPASSEPHEVELVNHWLHKGGIVLHFAGIDSISAAEGLIGLGVAIPRERRAALGEDEAYIGDLIGCTLVDVAGAEPVSVGAIEEVDTSAGPVPLLIVRGSADDPTKSREILIPFAKSYLRRLDLDGKRVEMTLPEGLVELNNAK